MRIKNKYPLLLGSDNGSASVCLFKIPLPIFHQMKYLIFSALICIIGFPSCKTASNTYFPTKQFSAMDVPNAPDYGNLRDWAAHPDKIDTSDSIPRDAPLGVKNEQTEAQIDVFFVYPTIYTGTEKGDTNWNADIFDAALNEKIDNSTILHQSSVFNGAGRVYAPRYRQAHIHIYYKTAEKESAKKAYDFAYEDVRRAFEYYLRKHNKGRPIIIAAHSQGTNHAERLLKDYFDGKPLEKQLVAAYLVGMPIRTDAFQSIPACTTPEQIGCFCTWNAYAKDYYPKTWENDLKYSVATNPLIWVTDETYASYEDNLGGVYSKFNFKPNFSDAQVKDGMVWIGTPKVFGAALLKTKRWHYAEYNLFYFNIRQNAKVRAEAFLKQ
jgi:hypothetical protein